MIAEIESVDLKVGKNCRGICPNYLSIEELAKVYAYYVVAFGYEHPSTRMALDHLRDGDTNYINRIRELEDRIEEYENEQEETRDEIYNMRDDIYKQVRKEVCNEVRARLENL